jgi:hypothetical protein
MVDQTPIYEAEREEDKSDPDEIPIKDRRIVT